MANLSTYLDLIPSANASKPNFTALVSTLCQGAVDAINFFETCVPQNFNVATAVGSQLDIIGQWVGISRFVTISLSNWFSFDTTGFGFDQGVWYMPGETLSGIERLDDSSYRALINAKILWNQYNGTTEALYSILVALFAPQPVTITDNQNGSITVSVVNNPNNSTLQNLATSGLLPFAPVGVQVMYSFAGNPVAVKHTKSLSDAFSVSDKLITTVEVISVSHTKSLSDSITLVDNAISTSTQTGSTSTALANQIYNDMGKNEKIPYELPSSYSFYSGAEVDLGNNLTSYNNGAGANAIEWWCCLYPYSANGSSGNVSTNTVVNVNNMAVYWLNSSTNAWTTVNMSWSDISGDQYSADWTTDYDTNPPNFAELNDGSWIFSVTNGRLSHCYAPYPRISVNDTEFGGVVVYCEARLVLLNANGTNDMSEATFVLDVGCDPYSSTTGNGIENNPNICLGKFKVVESNWRSFCATTLTLAQLEANPPPLNLTGVNP